MKIAVIGANGRSGNAFVQTALEAGHTIRAGVRGNHHFDTHPQLEIMTCDATNSDDLHRLLSGQDVVVSLIGHVKNSPADVQTDAMTKLIATMNDYHMTRVVSLTGTGVRFPGDRITLLDKILNVGVKLVDPKRINDGIHFVEELKKSDLDWTLIRVLKLQNTASKPYVLDDHGPTRLFVNRHEVAEAILTVLTDGSFVRRAPIISRKKK